MAWLRISPLAIVTTVAVLPYFESTSLSEDGVSSMWTNMKKKAAPPAISSAALQMIAHIDDKPSSLKRSSRNYVTQKSRFCCSLHPFRNAKAAILVHFSVLFEPRVKQAFSPLPAFWALRNFWTSPKEVLPNQAILPYVVRRPVAKYSRNCSCKCARAR